jgi:putative transposase
MRIVSNTTGQMRHLSKRFLTSISPEAKKRLKWIEYYEAHDDNVSLTCRHFDIGRSTFYRWKRRYDPRDLRSLEDRPSTPKKRRMPSWSAEMALAVKELREKYRCWGKDKLVILLRKAEWKISTSMVGRILRHLKATGQLVEPLRGRISARKRLVKRPYGVRKPKDYEVKEPGDLVQMDTLDVRPLPGVDLKHFTARDVVSKWDVISLRGRATAKTAKEFLEELGARAPYRVKAIQVDGGSEFMAEFEEACQDRGIRLFVLPPRSPKLNGCVERAQRTHTEEFYELSFAEPTISALGAELWEWERLYNEVRPHQSLGYLTPLEYIQTWQQKQAAKEAV